MSEVSVSAYISSIHHFLIPDVGHDIYNIFKCIFKTQTTTH